MRKHAPATLSRPLPRPTPQTVAGGAARGTGGVPSSNLPPWPPRGQRDAFMGRLGASQAGIGPFGTGRRLSRLFQHTQAKRHRPFWRARGQRMAWVDARSNQPSTSILGRSVWVCATSGDAVASGSAVGALGHHVGAQAICKNRDLPSSRSWLAESGHSTMIEVPFLTLEGLASIWTSGCWRMRSSRIPMA